MRKILSEQVEGYKRLAELLKKERICLLNFDAEGIEELSREKDTLLLRLRLLEEERKRLLAMAPDGKEDLTECSQSEHGSPEEIQSTLRSLIQSIGELNEFNRVLTDRSMNYINSTNNFLRTFGIEGEKKARGALLAQEV